LDYPEKVSHPLIFDKLMYNFAPVFIPTLNRYDHFRRCVESLSLCKNADNTDLVVALDYPLNDSHWEGYRKIDNYLGSIEGFKSVNIIRRDVNYGFLRNFTDGSLRVFENHDRIIYTEDDNEFSPGFLDYINDGLQKHEKNPRVFAVCGYNFPIRMPDDYQFDIYYAQAYCAWGFGSWKEKFLNIYSLSKPEISNDKKVLHRLKWIMPKPYDVLRKDLTSDKIYIDGRINYYLLKHNMGCIFPYYPLVKNTGFDGTGEHCGIDDYYQGQTKNDGFIPNAFPGSVAQNKKINKLLKRYFSYTNKELFYKYVTPIWHKAKVTLNKKG
jgi:hypothetical protein